MTVRSVRNRGERSSWLHGQPDIRRRPSPFLPGGGERSAKGGADIPARGQRLPRLCREPGRLPHAGGWPDVPAGGVLAVPAGGVLAVPAGAVLAILLALDDTL